tara:strand:+ start:37311 stop:38189 length:879 start_codon:yes stop_codon:yes gene_type:complete
MKKYLVVLAGSPRGGLKTWNSLIDYVLKPLDADLAICTGDRFYEKNLLSENAKYEWIFKEPENWFDYYEQNFQNNWKNFFEQGHSTGLYNSGSIHFAIKDIVLKNHLSDICNYKYLIYTRFDQFYTSQHIDIKNQYKKIFIPTGEDYFGIGDRHAVLDTDLAEKFLGICSYIDKDISTKELPEYLNCETAYLRFLKNENLIQHVSRYPRKQFTASLKEDKTNWRVAKYKVYFYKNLYIKYPDEFLDSIKNSLLSKGLLKLIIFEYKLVLNYIYLITRQALGFLKIKKYFKKT